MFVGADVHGMPHAHEIDMTVETYGGVAMQFIRHESLLSDRGPSTKCPWRGWYCPFHEAARIADLIVINVGYHGAGDPNETLSELHAIKKPHARIIVRSTHSPACDDMVWSVRQNRTFGRYNHDSLEKLNEITQSITRAWPHAYFLNVWTLSDMNGKGRFRPPLDCVHQCQPGPIDEWSKLFLSLANAIIWSHA